MPNLLLLLVMLTLSACQDRSKDIDMPTVSTQELASLEEEFLLELLRSQVTIASRAEDMQRAAEAFLDAPTEANRDDAQGLWLNLHQEFLKLIFFVQTFHIASEVDIYAVEAWPMHEGFLDYVDQYPHSGLINDITMPMTLETLISQHGVTDASEICLGFHALEFLLWSRQLSDYLPVEQLTPEQIKDGLNLADISNNRRRTAMSLITAQLHRDLTAIGDTYKSRMLTIESIEWLLGAAGDLITAADNELKLIHTSDAHSRFSHSSLADIKTRLRLYRRVYDGEGHLSFLLERISPESVNQISNSLAELEQCLDDKSDTLRDACLPLSGKLSQVVTTALKI